MSKKANPTLIGFFVVIGLALAMAGVILFGSAGWFAPAQKFILYFDASLMGLNPGAPVKFRGVTIGSVKDVLIRFQQAEDDFDMPVIIEVNQDLLRAKMDRSANFGDPERLEGMIRRGLRGLLHAQSLVTGLLYVELEILPDAAPPAFHQQKRIYPEIPTVSSDIQQLFDNLAQLDVKGLTEKLNGILDKLDLGLSQLQVREINAGLTNLLTSLNYLMASPELTNTLAATHETLREYRLLSEQFRAKLDPLSDEAASTLAETRQSLAQLRLAIQDLRDLLAPEAPLRHEAVQALDQLGRAAQAVADLAEFLTRNPNAILSGRKPPEPAP